MPSMPISKYHHMSSMGHAAFLVACHLQQYMAHAAIKVWEASSSLALPSQAVAESMHPTRALPPFSRHMRPHLSGRI